MPFQKTIKLGLVGSIVVLVVLAAGGSWWLNERAKWRTVTASILQQVDELSDTLPPGGEGTVVFQADGADELILIPKYPSQEPLEQKLADFEPALIEELLWIGRYDKRAPAFVWMKDGQIAAITSLEKSVGLMPQLERWRLDGEKHEIQVAKEEEQKHGRHWVLLMGREL